MWIWAIAAVLAGGIIVALFQHRARRGVYTPLASRQPLVSGANEKKPLGMEATDLDVVASANRRNESLERGHTSWTRRKSGFFLGGADVDVRPWADDETYARRYFSAFKKSDMKDK